MSECTHNCETCGQSCSSRQGSAPDFRAQPHEKSKIKKVIGVVSGKGGVGKSMTSGLLAVLLNRRGRRTAVLDADITGPSIPRLFGLHEKARANESGIYPAVTETGIQVMSTNLLLENENDPVVWRGPVIAGAVKQFWQEVIWDDVDFMFVDMPPGTGDVPLTVFQSLPVDGIVVVTSPQELVGMIVEKAVKMAQMMHIPVLGVVENMSYLPCPDCGKKIHLFGESHIASIAEQYHIPVLAQCPVDPALAQLADTGKLEQAQTDCLDGAAEVIDAMLSSR